MSDLRKEAEVTPPVEIPDIRSGDAVEVKVNACNVFVFPAAFASIKSTEKAHVLKSFFSLLCMDPSLL